MFSYIKTTYFEVFLKALCFLKYRQRFLISHEEAVSLYLWMSFLYYTRKT